MGHAVSLLEDFIHAYMKSCPSQYRATITRIKRVRACVCVCIDVILVLQRVPAVPYETRFFSEKPVKRLYGFPFTTQGHEKRELFQLDNIYISRYISRLV